MNIKILLITGLLSLGIGGCSNAQNKQTEQSSQTETMEKTDTMENVNSKNSSAQDFWQSGIIINGVRIVLPCKLADLEKLGWKLVGERTANIMLEPQNGTAQTDVINEKGQSLHICLFDPYSKAIPLKDGFIIEVSKRVWLHVENLVDFEIGGLRSFESTGEEVLKVMNKHFGEPIIHDTNREWQESYYFSDKKEIENKIEFILSRSEERYAGKLVGFGFRCIGDMCDTEKYK